MAVQGARPRAGGGRAFYGIRWFHIPVSVGIGVLAFVQIRRMLKDGRRHRDRYGPTPWQVSLTRVVCNSFLRVNSCVIRAMRKRGGRR